MNYTKVKEEISSLLKQTEAVMGLPHHSPHRRNYLLGKKATLSHLKDFVDRIEKREKTTA